MRRERYGWRANIGIISPGLGSTITREWNCVLPEGVAFHHAMLELPHITSGSLLELRSKVVAEARKLVASGSIDILLFNCTSGSFIGGADYDQTLIQELEEATGVPSTTSSTCDLMAFADLSVKSVALIGPYSQELMDLAIKFLKQNEIETVYSKGLGYNTNQELAELSLSPYTYYSLARKANQSAPEVDAIFIICGSSPALKVINSLEKDLGKPVVSSCSTALYGVLKLLCIKERIDQYGRLLALLD